MTAIPIGTVIGRRKAPRDPEFPTDPVRSHSWDVADPKANPGQRIGDGSPEFAWAFRDALRHQAYKLYEEHHRSDYAGAYRIHRAYLPVIDALLHFLDHKTGELTPAYATIAERALVHTNTAKRAIEAFEHWGLINHVRRSAKIEGAEGQAGPQRRQVSNAYYFDCRRAMSADHWTRFWSRVVFNLRRVGHAAARRAAVLKHTFNERARQAPRAKGELGHLLAQMSRGRFLDDPPAVGASASP